MKKILGLMFVLVLILAAAPAFADKVTQTWKCELDNEITEDQAVAEGKEWLAAAKKVKGGENIKGFLRFPVAVDATGEVDVVLEVIFPSFEEWGRFWDNYGGSEAGELEDKNVDDGIVCPDSAIWEIEALQ